MSASGPGRPLAVVLLNFKGASAQLQQDKGQHSTEPKSLREAAKSPQGEWEAPTVRKSTFQTKLVWLGSHVNGCIL